MSQKLNIHEIADHMVLQLVGLKKTDITYSEFNHVIPGNQFKEETSWCKRKVQLHDRKPSRG
jgi:hypothetical protein